MRLYGVCAVREPHDRGRALDLGMQKKLLS